MVHIPSLELKESGYWDNDKRENVYYGDPDYSLTKLLEDADAGRPVLIDPAILAVMARRIDAVSQRLGLPPMGGE